MPVITVYATGAGFNSKTTGSTETPEEDVLGGGLSVAFWSWLDAPAFDNLPPDTTTVISATLHLYCKSTTEHNHGIHEASEGGYIGTYIGTGAGGAGNPLAISLDVTSVVAGWVEDPATAYGFISDHPSGQAFSTSTHSMEGYDTARITIEYISNSPPVVDLLTPENESQVAEVAVDWVYSDPDGDPQAQIGIARKRLP